MGSLERAMRRLEAGHKMRFYQDFYRRQWVKVTGGWAFWRSGRIYLRNEEILELKRALARRNGVRSESGVGAASADPA